jgi:hypothetical protein
MPKNIKAFLHKAASTLKANNKQMIIKQFFTRVIGPDLH